MTKRSPYMRICFPSAVVFVCKKFLPVVARDLLFVGCVFCFLLNLAICWNKQLSKLKPSRSKAK